MSDTEIETKASISVIWTEGVLDGEPVRVSSVNGINRIIIGGFDTHVPGKYGGDAKKILEAYQMQIEETEKAFARMLDESDDSSCCEDNCGLIGITEEELDELVREYEKHRGQIIDIKTRKSI